jgi:hypothetical protein
MSFLVDMRITATDFIRANGMFFIENTAFNSTGVSLTISYKTNTNIIHKVGVFEDILNNTQMNASYNMINITNIADNDTFNELNRCAGLVVIGNPSSVSDLLGHYAYSLTETALAISTIIPMADGITALIVNGEYLTGTVVIEAAEGVALDVVEENGIPVIKIGLEGSLNTVINSDADIIADLTNKNGPPICTINNIKPNTAYNFTVQGDDCLEVSGSSNGIAITNPCGTPCCEETEYMAEFKASIKNLEDKADILEKGTDTLTELLAPVVRNLNTLQDAVCSGMEAPPQS